MTYLVFHLIATSKRSYVSNLLSYHHGDINLVLYLHAIIKNIGETRNAGNKVIKKLVKRNFIKKYLDFVLLFSPNGDSIKIKDFGRKNSGE